MGMAAGQARLLSITSRMSDNELRAQLINNDKMRLATKSSQVSEAYVQALNEASLMFTNYDKDNNASYQQLTFNALTAYNPYNNQYALSNASGKILVSENDACNFQQSNSLEDFLGKYGLKETTTYWDSIGTYVNPNTDDKTTEKYIYYPTTDVDSEGNIVYSDGFSAETLKQWYEGTNEDGYLDIVSSDYYYHYTSALETFDEAHSALLKKINANKRAQLDTYLAELEKETTTKDKLKKLKELLDKTGSIGSRVDDTYSDYLNLLTKTAQNAEEGYSYAEVNITYNSANESDLSYNGGYIIYDSYAIKKDTTTGNYKVYEYYDEDDMDEDGTTVLHPKGVGNLISPAPTVTTVGGKLKIETEIKDDDGTPRKNIIEGIPPTQPDNNTKFTIVHKEGITEPEKGDILNSVIADLKASISKLWKSEEFIPDKGDEWVAFVEAGNELANALGVTPPSTEDYDEYVAISNLDLSKANEDSNYGRIVRATILDNVMNTYGEPKYTWIDKSSPSASYNENAEAKAQWYTNLYERMQKGYTTLKDGLASSPEWIKFAFESGLVTMEQVDSYNSWNNLIYTNCSDITEQTDSAAVAKAEAEYNAAMNKIENKDKMYDLELKNIDTEHNSLQTEYESIKTAIDKNIERTFKIYS